MAVPLEPMGTYDAIAVLWPKEPIADSAEWVNSDPCARGEGGLCAAGPAGDDDQEYSWVGKGAKAICRPRKVSSESEPTAPSSGCPSDDGCFIGHASGWAGEVHDESNWDFGQPFEFAEWGSWVEACDPAVAGLWAAQWPQTNPEWGAWGCGGAGGAGWPAHEGPPRVGDGPRSRAALSRGARSHEEVPKTVDLRGRFLQQPAQGVVTTLMIRNVPNDYSRSSLMEELDGLGFSGKYDFLYLPFDASTRHNVGYAFVNLETPEDARQLMAVLQGHRFLWQSRGKVRSAAVSVAHIQGLAANLAHYIGTSVFSQRNPQLGPWVRRRGTDTSNLSSQINLESNHSVPWWDDRIYCPATSTAKPQTFSVPAPSLSPSWATAASPAAPPQADRAASWCALAPCGPGAAARDPGGHSPGQSPGSELPWSVAPGGCVGQPARCGHDQPQSAAKAHFQAEPWEPLGHFLPSTLLTEDEEEG